MKSMNETAAPKNTRHSRACFLPCIPCLPWSFTGRQIRSDHGKHGSHGNEFHQRNRAPKNTRLSKACFLPCIPCIPWSFLGRPIRSDHGKHGPHGIKPMNETTLRESSRFQESVSFRVFRVFRGPSLAGRSDQTTENTDHTESNP